MSITRDKQGEGEGGEGGQGQGGKGQGGFTLVVKHWEPPELAAQAAEAVAAMNLDGGAAGRV